MCALPCDYSEIILVAFRKQRGFGRESFDLAATAYGPGWNKSIDQVRDRWKSLGISYANKWKGERDPIMPPNIKQMVKALKEANFANWPEAEGAAAKRIKVFEG